ncbi:hypothetical protein ACQKL5_16215 [Peribacillus sp. NPDC097675]|uniref:hypothetical protein n=1 Tax=Peribacillus sp. NPDC097675 TaxID=3390618 RepID=UPI003D076D60
MDEQILNTSEALKILRKHYITDEIQMVTRFIRSGRLKAEKDTRKNGYRIREEDLYEFIEEEKPGMVQVIYTYEKYIEQLHVKSEPEKYIQILLSEKNGVAKKETPSLLIFDENGTTDTRASEQPIANQKIDQDDAFINETLPIKPSGNWIYELFEHPSFQTKLSEWSKANPINQDQSKVNRKESRNKHKYHKLSYENLIKILKGQKTGKKILELYSDKQLEFVYTCYYENGQMRETLFNNEKGSSVYICPVSKKEKNQWLHLLVATHPDIVEAMEKTNSSRGGQSSGEGDDEKESLTVTDGENGVP